MQKNASSKISSNSISIAIIGVDGSGKSTCFKQLFEKLTNKNIAGIGDKVLVKKNNEIFISKLWMSRLKVFLGTKVKRLKNRKLYRIFKFLELLLRVKLSHKIDRIYNPEFIITDGAPAINILGWGHYYCPEVYSKELLVEVIGYLKGKKIPKHRKAFFKKHSHEFLLINSLRIKFRIPDIVFFLKVSADTAMERIKSRNEVLQPHETVEFLHNLQESYIKVCHLLKETRVYYIDTNNKTIETVIDEIITMLAEL
jgi:thymidylate kinase